jgi:hypothetical protein
MGFLLKENVDENEADQVKGFDEGELCHGRQEEQGVNEGHHRQNLKNKSFEALCIYSQTCLGPKKVVVVQGWSLF